MDSYTEQMGILAIWWPVVVLQLNLSTTTTLGTEESGFCIEVEPTVNVWTVCQKKNIGCCGELVVNGDMTVFS